VSSVDSMFLRVVRGEWAADWVVGAGMAMGRGCVLAPRIMSPVSSSWSSGDPGIEGPLGEAALDRLNAGDEREASF